MATTLTGLMMGSNSQAARLHRRFERRFAGDGHRHGIRRDHSHGDPGASLLGSRRTALNTLIDVLTLGIIGNIMNLPNMPDYHHEVVEDVIVLVAMLLQSFSRPRGG